jgi:hypothetical protein
MLDYMDSSFDSVNSDISFTEDIYDFTRGKKNIKETISNIKHKENKSRLANNIGTTGNNIKVTWMTFYENLVRGIMSDNFTIKELKMRMFSSLKTTGSARIETNKEENTFYDYRFKYEERQQKGFVNNILTKFNDPMMIEKSKILNTQRSLTKTIESERNVVGSKRSSMARTTKFAFFMNKMSTQGSHTLSPNTSTSDGTMPRKLERRKTIQDIITPGKCFIIK